MTYIEGGSIPGNDVVHEGCSDTTSPLDDVPLELPQSLYFAGWSERAWEGTAAGFITLDAQTPSALARAYLITPTQFAEVVTQENANIVNVGDVDLNVEGARKHGHIRMVPKGFYSELVYCGQRDGHPMLSFTASRNRTDYNAPSAHYLRVIGSGLKECHGLSTHDVVAYLINTPGVRGTWTASQLEEVLHHTQGPAAKARRNSTDAPPTHDGEAPTASAASSSARADTAYTRRAL
jgi:hypothetical protein